MKLGRRIRHLASDFPWRMVKTKSASKNPLNFPQLGLLAIFHIQITADFKRLKLSTVTGIYRDF